MQWGAKRVTAAAMSLLALVSGWRLFMWDAHSPEQKIIYYGRDAMPRQQFDLEENLETGFPKSISFSVAGGRAFVLYSQLDNVLPASGDAASAYVRVLAAKLMKRSGIPEAATKRFLIRGHADVRQLGVNVDNAGVCTSPYSADPVYVLAQTTRLEPTSNACLALMRAYRVASEINTAGIREEGELIEVDYDPDPFMESTNRMVDGNIYRFLQAPSKTGARYSVKGVRRTLSVPDGFSHHNTEGYNRVRQALDKDPDGFARQLQPFRSVVVFVQECFSRECGAAWGE